MEILREVIRKAADMMNDCSDISLASINEQGYPRTCIMTRLNSDGIKKVYFATGVRGIKSRHFQANPKASACVWKDNNRITLMGLVNVIKEGPVLEEMWQERLLRFFPEGVKDPNYCVLEFTTEDATLWMDGETVTVGTDYL